MKKSNTAITLDWLSFYIKYSVEKLPILAESERVDINNDLFLIGKVQPTQYFLNFVEIIYKGERCGQILYMPRNERFCKKDKCKIEFVNHTLYSGIWYEIYLQIKEYGMSYVSPSRIDIAIDGLSDIHKILNVYAKQYLNEARFKLKNSNTIRARFSPMVMNPKTRLFENFHIGGSGSYKMITVYNKSLEITKSGKEYISDWWKANGVVGHSYSFVARQKMVEDVEKKGNKCYRITKDDVFRFEMRLKPEAINEIKEFDIERLEDKSYLASILLTHCIGFFEMVSLKNGRKKK